MSVGPPSKLIESTEIVGSSNRMKPSSSACDYSQDSISVAAGLEVLNGPNLQEALRNEILGLREEKALLKGRLRTYELQVNGPAGREFGMSTLHSFDDRSAKVPIRLDVDF